MTDQERSTLSNNVISFKLACSGCGSLIGPKDLSLSDVAKILREGDSKGVTFLGLYDDDESTTLLRVVSTMNYRGESVPSYEWMQAADGKKPTPWHPIRLIDPKFVFTDNWTIITQTYLDDLSRKEAAAKDSKKAARK